MAYYKKFSTFFQHLTYLLLFSFARHDEAKPINLLGKQWIELIMLHSSNPSCNLGAHVVQMWIMVLDGQNNVHIYSILYFYINIKIQTYQKNILLIKILHLQNRFLFSAKEDIIVYACDCSMEALDMAKKMIDAADKPSIKNRFHTFLLDFSENEFPKWLFCHSCRSTQMPKQIYYSGFTFCLS